MKLDRTWKSNLIRTLLILGLGLGANNAFAQGDFNAGNQSGSVDQSSVEDRQIISAAERARRNALNSLDAAKGRQVQSEKAVLKNATSNQIRSQLQTIKDLNSTVIEAAADRKQKLAKLENEMQEMLAKIRALRHQKSQRSHSQPSPQVTQVSEKKSAAESVNSNPSGSETRPLTAPLNDGSQQPATEEKEFGDLVRDPVDKLSLADTLIESQNYRTAMAILLDLQNDKSMSETDLNWIRYQLARCYRRLRAFPEAEKHLRDAANSSKQEIARTTAIWWLEQMDKQKKMFESLDAMDQQLENLGQDDAVKQ